MKENFKIELNKVRKEAFDKWFERGWTKEHLEKEFLRSASIGNDYSTIDIEVKDNAYETSRRSDPRFVKKLKEMFPTLKIEIENYQTSVLVSVMPWTKKEVTKKHVVISWEDENE